ncbi:hypothetical protein [Rubritalea marina]|uniref:hypothetical protein n=1 Tax=Rubritalea marina TaxID=361055 RepID=UPI00037660F3|nr:hypothetical protein [Rubritalea marina]
MQFILGERGISRYGLVMAQALWMRLRDERWADYQVASGEASALPKLLQDLAGRKKSRAMKAAHQLWVMLCKGELQSAALVVLPYLFECLDMAAEDVQFEIIDILKSCLAKHQDLDSEGSTQFAEALKAGGVAMSGTVQRSRGDVRVYLEDVQAQCLAL